YFIKGTFIYPVPPGSSQLLKFSAAMLSEAQQSGNPLQQADSELSMPLDGGYDLSFRSFEGKGELYISTISDSIYRYKEGSSSAELFFKAIDVANPGSPPSFTALSIFKPFGRFDATGLSQSILGIATAT